MPSFNKYELFATLRYDADAAAHGHASRDDGFTIILFAI